MTVNLSAVGEADVPVLIREIERLLAIADTLGLVFVGIHLNAAREAALDSLKAGREIDPS